MPPLIVPAPAKLNLFLHVTGRRGDGRHLLETLFVALDFGDTVTLALRDDGAIRRAGGWQDVPEDADLAVRAARALKSATGCSGGADIAVTKRIPVGGGLGGGSSDAASVLLALNRMWDLRLPRARLMEHRCRARRGCSLLSVRRAGVRLRHRRDPPAGDGAADVGRGDRARAKRLDRGHLRGARIDTRHAVGENGRLFRGLWPE